MFFDHPSSMSLILQWLNDNGGPFAAGFLFGALMTATSVSIRLFSMRR